MFNRDNGLPDIKQSFLTKEIEEFLNKHKELSVNQKRMLTPIIIRTNDYDTYRKLYYESCRKLKRMYTLPMLTLSNYIYYKTTSYIVLPLYYMYQWQEFLAIETRIILPFDELKPPKHIKEVSNKFLKFGEGSLETTINYNNKVYLKGKNKVLFYDVKDKLLKINHIPI